MTVVESSDDVILRDGTTLRLRPPTPADRPALLDFFAGLSLESLHSRFHGSARVDEAMVLPFLEPDWSERGSLIAAVAEGMGAERVIAQACYVRLRDRSRAEVAFAVADAHQHRGIATRLLERLAHRGGQAGIEQFTAVVMPANAAMLRVFEHVGFEATRKLDRGEIEVRFPIERTAHFLEEVDHRDHDAVHASLAPFFAPRSLAVVGASARRGSIGGELFRNVLRASFGGPAYPVNRSGEPVAGARGYASIDDIEGDIDLAVICVPAEHVLDTAEDCLLRGIKALCVISAGFAETGESGAAQQDELVALVRAHGARLIGPNCLGVAVAATKLNATFARSAIPSGNIGFSSQSGALGLALIEAAEARGVGLSAFVSIGNKADISSNDLLEWWEDDDDTALVMLYLESFGNPQKFARLARRVAQTKPVLAMKSGNTSAGARAASSHTAALAGSDAAVDALFRQAGVLRADTLEELLDLAALLSRAPLPHGRRVGVLTNAGGLGILCADACELAGIALPRLSDETVSGLREFMPAAASDANPVDLLGSAVAEDYERAVALLLADPCIDALIVLFAPPVSAGAADVADAIERAALGASKPVLASLLAAERVEPRPAFVDFPYPESAARALGRAADRADWLRRPAGAAPILDGLDSAGASAIVRDALIRSPDSWLAPEDGARLLESYGIPFVAQRIAYTPADAVEAARALGFPVVVKCATAGAHKTETGGVALDVRGEAAVEAAVYRMGCPVVVQPMVRGGVELLAGVVQDPRFGPLVAFGVGGTLAELVGEVAFRLAPLTDVDTSELVTSGKAGRLLAGFRGAAAADTAAVQDLLHRLARLASDLPEVAELDLNPVVALPDGCVAVDVRVRVALPWAPTGPKTW